ncbi:MAG TPA: hypothetical protein PKH31_03835 [Candidatus Sumerlaeota bacterium]|nr:hypothetical protein [Candidatus Sumerlaeota bacterium]
MSDSMQKHIEGILHKLDDFLDQRYAQGKRLSSLVAVAEADMRMQQQAVLRQILVEGKGFGPLRIAVVDILTSFDLVKKNALFHTVDQVCILNEIVPEEKDDSGKKTAGQLDIRSIKKLYSAIDPSFERLLSLLQTWIWWDLRDAADLYTFDLQISKTEQLKTINVDDALVETYRKEMGAKPGTEIRRQDMIKFELQRSKLLIAQYGQRRDADHGHEIILVAKFMEGTPDADASCVRLASHLTAIEKLRVLQGEVNDQVKQIYAPQLRLPAEKVTAQAILDLETRSAAQERKILAEAMSKTRPVGEMVNYKRQKMADMLHMFAAACQAFGVTPDQIVLPGN